MPATSRLASVSPAHVVAVLLAAAVTVGAFTGLLSPAPSDEPTLGTFESRKELAAFLRANDVGPVRHHADVRLRRPVAEGAAVSAAGGDASASGAVPHSTTNVQVPGVDEADIVETDGRHLYALDDGDVVIVEATPPRDARLAARIDPDGIQLHRMTLRGDRLVVFGRPGPDVDRDPHDRVIDTVGHGARAIAPRTAVHVYDVGDPSAIQLRRAFTVDGAYVDSRRVDDQVYLIVDAPARLDDDGDPVVPTVRPGQTGFPEIHYVDAYARAYRYTTVLAVDVDDDQAPVRSETYLVGRSTERFASRDDLYLVTPATIHPGERVERFADEVVRPEAPPRLDERLDGILASDLGPSETRREIVSAVEAAGDPRLEDRVRARAERFREDLARELDRSRIHRIALDDGEISHEATGEVPGDVLDQFSMDERADRFRIATTTQVGRSRNNLYVLSPELEIVGRTEGLAPGEEIHSARFVGDRAYLVTFRVIDPLFVVDLADPTAPQVVGELKVPGVSEYLHPYDEEHLIGVGRAGDASGRLGGVKLSLFDVGDPYRPVTVARTTIGSRLTDSEALRDHHAFLYRPDRDLVVLPVEERVPRVTHGHDRDRPPSQGAYAYRVTPSDGFELRGRIVHRPDASDDPWATRIRRTLTVGDALYSLSDTAVEAHALDDLRPLARVDIG